jgi:hypothetical protein
VQAIVDGPVAMNSRLPIGTSTSRRRAEGTRTLDLLHAVSGATLTVWHCGSGARVHPEPGRI